MSPGSIFLREGFAPLELSLSFEMRLPSAPSGGFFARKGTFCEYVYGDVRSSPQTSRFCNSYML